jgi:outer membrane protein OmpA-like peptidoglycan-associated protein
LTVLFSPGSSVLNAEASKHISNIIKKMESDPSLRLQLVAYATSTDDNPSRARRLSLSRALAVRSNIVEKGVKSSRMDVLALGSKFKKAPGDRVDAVPLP